MSNQTPPASAPTAAASREPQPGSPAWWKEKLLSPERLESLRRVETPHLKAERAVQCLTNVLMIKNSDLLDCLPASISVALQTAVALGLEPGTYIHFIPFKDASVGLICQTVVDYRGLIRIAMRSPLVAKIEARAVFPGDDFRVEYGDEERIHHIPDLESDKRSGPDLRFVYAIVTLSNGQKVRHVMTRKDVENIKAMAKGSSSSFSPWSDPKHGYIEMARKTAARAVLKYVPVEETVAQQIREADATEFDFEAREEERRALPMVAASQTGNAAARGLMDELNARRAPQAEPARQQAQVEPLAEQYGRQQARPAEEPRPAAQAAQAAPAPNRSPQAPASPQAARTAPVAQNWSGRPQPKPEPAPQARPARPPAPEIDESDIPF